MTFRYAPGHTQDLQVVQIENHLFTGDSLFNKSNGRTDLPGGDATAQFDSLQRLMTQPEDTVNHPGHDYNNQLAATMGQVRQENPRVQISDCEQFVRLMGEVNSPNDQPDNLTYYVAFNSR